jgi:hypothetical protein
MRRMQSREGTPLHFMSLPIGRTAEGGLCIGVHQIEKAADILALRPPGKPGPLPDRTLVGCFWGIRPRTAKKTTWALLGRPEFPVRCF